MLCIIQDTTNSKTVNERVTLNLPASTLLKKLFEDVASKVGYVNGTFDLVWGNGDNVTDTVWQKCFLFPVNNKHLRLHVTEKMLAILPSAYFIVKFFSLILTKTCSMCTRAG